MKVRYHRYAHERSFRSVKALTDHARKEAAKFAELQQSNKDAFGWWAGTLASHWDGIVNTVSSHPDDGHALQRHLHEYPVFPFDSSLTRTLFEMSGHGRKAAAQEIIPFLKGMREDYSSHNFTIGQVSAHSEFRLALASDIYSSTAKEGPIDRLTTDHEARLACILEADENKLQEQRSEYSSFIELARKKAEAFDRSASEFLYNAQNEWTATHTSYIDQLATETAVELWSNRSKGHMTRYKSVRGWVIGFGVGGFLAAITWIFAGFALARWAFTDDKTAQLASYTAGSIALFTLLVWGLRVLIRSMMSEDHLSTDASARSALAHTYLALIKQQAATENDRAIILAALFAPVSDGLVKDDGMPAFSPASLAAQALTKP